MSGQGSSSGRLPSDYSSELHGAAPAQVVSPSGSVRTELTPATSSSGEMPNPVRPVPNPVRPVPNPVRNADAELERRLSEHDRGADGQQERDRSRDRPHRHSIATPTGSRPTTPRRATPVSPPILNDRVSGLQGEVFELNRRLRNAEAQAHQHGHRLEQQAAESITAVYQQEELMKQRFEAWGQGANSEIDSLLNSFHASTVRGEHGEQTIVNLEARLQYVEGAAAETSGRNAELGQTTARIQAAEL